MPLAAREGVVLDVRTERDRAHQRAALGVEHGRVDPSAGGGGQVVRGRAPQQLHGVPLRRRVVLEHGAVTEGHDAPPDMQTAAAGGGHVERDACAH